MSETRLANLFSRRPALFRGLPDPDCVGVLSRAQQRQYSLHDVIFCEGDRVKEVCLLMEGRVKITKVSQTGVEVVLRLNTAGEIVGLPRFEPGDIHCSTAQAVGACSLLAWDAGTFEEVLEEFPILARNAASIVEETLLELECRFCEMATARAAPRLAGVVLRLAEQLCPRVEGPMEIDVSQEMMGQMTAITPPTVSRLLAKWEEQGLVNARRGSLLICDVAALETHWRAGWRRGARLQRRG